MRMNSLIEKGLTALKARQKAGELMVCPRCGRDSMKPELVTNALSRYAEIYICDDCGTAEAILDLMGRPFLPDQWDAFRSNDVGPGFRDQ